jgi:hypothetical protein
MVPSLPQGKMGLWQQPCADFLNGFSCASAKRRTRRRDRQGKPTFSL